MGMLVFPFCVLDNCFSHVFVMFLVLDNRFSHFFITLLYLIVTAQATIPSNHGQDVSGEDHPGRGQCLSTKLFFVSILFMFSCLFEVTYL